MLNPTKSATQQFLRTNWNWEQKLRLFVYQYQPHRFDDDEKLILGTAWIEIQC